MRVNVITDDAGNVVAATQNRVVGDPEEVANTDVAQDTAGVVLLPGQRVTQVEISDSLFSADSSTELYRYLTEALSS